MCVDAEFSYTISLTDFWGSIKDARKLPSDLTLSSPGVISIELKVRG